MSYFFKNTRKFALVLSALLLAVTLAAGSFAYAAKGLPVKVEEEPEQSDHMEDFDEANSDADYEDGNSLELTQLSVEPPVFNRPGEMRGVYLVPGADFIKKADDESGAIKADIDKAVEAAKGLGMNSAVIDTVYGDKVIFNTADAPAFSEDFDVMEYLVDKCREAGLYTYAIFDASLIEGDADKLSENAYEFAMKYQPDGVLIDGYETQSAGSFSDYVADGGSIGFDNYVRQTAALTVKTAAKAVRRANPSIQAGLLAGPVWANDTDDPLGSATKAKHTSLYSGNADTRSYVLRDMVDFVAVTAYGSSSDAEIPFGAVAGWWADVASEGEIPLYIVHASGKAGSQEAGWSSEGELARQVAEAQELSGCYGSIFNNLSKMSGGAGTAVTEIYGSDSKPEPQHVAKELSVTKPDKLTYTTSEPNVTFAGAADPSLPVTLNGETVETDASGYFAVTKNLSTGLNSFTLSQNGKDISYSITRDMQLIKEISPTGVVMAESDMSITISAVAIEGADVYAKINGDTVDLQIDDDAQIDEDKNSGFKLYTGEYVAPESDDDEEIHILGGITVYASYNGAKQTVEGAHLAVNKKSKDMTPVQITADQAMTYPADTLNNVPTPAFYPLPKGAQDYAVGEEVKYTKASTKETFYYRVLASGMRVETKDLKEISSGPSNNKISGLEVKNGDDGYTYITVKTAQKVTYSVTYKSDSFTVQFHNTTSTPSKTTLKTNNMFDKATWSNDDTLTLTLNKSNCFMGYKGYYDKSGNLVFRFNNPPSSIKEAKIAIDPGHGGKDVGTLGFNKDYHESVIAASIAEKLAAELEDRGAEVVILDSAGVDSKDRPAMAEDFEADLFVSVHCNSAANTKAVGTETFYFYPFSKAFATSAAANVSAQLDSTNRGAKPSYYNVTLSPQMTSILVETGFMTNKTEYAKLIKSSYQKKIATGIADSIVAAIKSAKTGVTVIGTTKVESDEYDEYDDYDDYDEEDEDSGTVTASGSGELGLSATLLRMREGEKYTLDVDTSVKWKSSDTSVATVTSKGVVTAKSEGTATITATDKETGETAECKVTVGAVGTPGVKIKKLYITSGAERLAVGETAQLEIDYDPSDAYDTTVKWSSSKTSVATVDSNGKVKAIKEGTAVITATSTDGGNVKSTTCDVTVVGGAAIPDTGIALSKASGDVYLDYDYLRIYPGNSERVTILDENGDVVRNADFKWKSDDTKVATVDSKGVVTAKAVGDVIITATYGKNTLECDIEVSKTKVAVKGVKLNKTSTVIVRGKAEQLKATLSPYDATEKTVTWSSSNSRVASVDSSGNVTGKSAGTATITVKTKTGGYTAKCSVEVVRKDIEIEEIDLEYPTLEMKTGETVEMTYTLWPDNATVTDIVWSSSNTKYATVDQDGVVTAVAKGKATIKATSSKDKTIYAQCVVTVYK